MKHIFVKAPAVAALFVVACASSQKNLSDPQKAALKAEEHAQDAQNDAQKARKEANRSQQDLNEMQQSNVEARKEEINANQRAQQASFAAGRAEQQAGMAAHPPPAGPPPGAPAPAPAPPNKGVTEAQAPAPAPSPPKLVVITSGLLFPTNGSNLSDGSKAKLDEVAIVLTKQPESSEVIIQGHTDDRGDKAVNMRLSQERAQSVADYLESKGVPKDRVQTKAMGSDDPVSTEKTTSGRAVNRRVDIAVQPAQEQGK
jgi:outer membrane protein OmpA-like peptidoglycan-associated protein